MAEPLQWTLANKILGVLPVRAGRARCGTSRLSQIADVSRGESCQLCSFAADAAGNSIRPDKTFKVKMSSQPKYTCRFALQVTWACL